MISVPSLSITFHDNDKGMGHYRVAKREEHTQERPNSQKTIEKRLQTKSILFCRLRYYMQEENFMASTFDLW